MKKTHIVLFVLVLVTGKLQAQEYHFYQDGKKVQYSISPDEVLVKFKQHGARNQFDKLKTDPDVKSSQPLGDNQTAPQIVKLDHNSALNSFIAKAKLNAEVEYVSPILVNARGRKVGAMTNEFIVRLKSKNHEHGLTSLLARYDVSVKEKYAFDDRTFILTSNTKKRNTLELSSLFHESGLFEWAEPNLLLNVTKATADPFYSQQWSLHNTTAPFGGFTDADIDAPEAWSITAGCSAIRIAVLDDGVDLFHPDLTPNLLPGFDATGAGTGGGNATSADSHGTNCAGLIAAAGNNNLGIVGVAYKSKLVPVRVHASNTWPTASQFASSIDWAGNNADVISISINAETNSSLINDAISRAVTLGRGGKGCVFLVATGNYDLATIEIPSSNPNVIAVGATNTCDRRYSGTSCGGNGRGSNYGPGLDVMAPGVKLYTTDLRGAWGENPGDYLPTFGGTSGSAPIAAGVMALILSVNPNLTSTEARAVLERNTDKNTNYSFSTVSGQPNGTWNNEMGYGRINAFKALYSLFTISGPEVLCSSSTYAVSGVPATTASWTGYNVTPSSGSGLSATVSPNGLGSGWIEWTIVNSSCNNPIKVRKNVFVRDYIEGTYTTNSGSTFTLSTTNSVVAGTTSVKLSYPGISSYSWVKTNGPTIYYSIFDSGKQARIDLASGQSVTFRVTATGPCGTSVSRNLTFYVMGGWSYSVSPNPSSSTITVEATSNEEQTRGSANSARYFDNPERKVSVRLYNKHQQVVAIGELENGKLILDVADLPTGIYHLQIADGKNTSFQRVVINH